MSVRIFAPAKINLTLQVGRPRADGLHPLQSVVAFASVGDWVEAAPAGEFSLHVEGPFASALAGESDNLVLRAARLLAQAAGVGEGAALKLEKHLPVASGIGGGSSDAAAALKACNQLWGLDWSEEILAALSGSLGSDVPVCVAARAAYMTGVGQSFAPLSLPSFDAVLINPLKPLPTPAVYRQFDRQGLGERFRPAPAPSWTDRNRAIENIAAINNDLYGPAQTLEPAIAEIGEALAEDPLRRAYAVSISGSGATVFALTKSENDANGLAADLATAHPAWWIAPTRLA